MLVESWMTRNVVTIAHSQSITEAEEMLAENDLRRIPVVDEGKLIGIVCDTDILKAKPSVFDPDDEKEEGELFSSLGVDQVMTDNPVTVTDDAPIEEAVLLMRSYKINSIPVVQNNLLVGIITETNIFQAFLEVMGAEKKGARMELLLPHGASFLYAMFELFQKQEIELLAFSMYPEFSKEQQQVTVKIRGDNLDSLMEELWEKGIKINQLLHNENA